MSEQASNADHPAYQNPVEAGAAVIIDRVKGAHRNYVLACLGLEHPTPYVVWEEHTRPNGRKLYLSGDYFFKGQLLKAAEVLARRAN